MKRLLRFSSSRLLQNCILAGLLVASTGGLLLAAEPAIHVERNVPVPMRDGVILRADVYRPAEAGTFPVLVLRTPYGKDRQKPEAYVRAGYIVVTQDARGRYHSDGQFESLIRFQTHDGEDGYDTVEWAAKLPGSTGKVGTFGASYNAFLQWRLAPLRPPSLVAMSAQSIPARMTDLEGPGTIRPGRRLKWWYATISPDLRQRANRPGPRTATEANKLWAAGEGEKLLQFLPWLQLPDYVFEDETEAVQEWLRAPHRDPWQLDRHADQIAVPNLDVVGWFDHCNGDLALYRAMVDRGRTEIARQGQRLIIGPWSHSGRGSRKVGEVDFGPEARFDVRAAEIRWFNYWLKGEANGVDKDAPIRLFVMGANRWRDESEWPLQRARSQELFLTSGGAANTPSGDGRLATARPKQSRKDQYIYDPRDPVPTLWTAAMFTVPADQRPLAKRQDILVYQTEPLTEAIEVTGHAEVVLYANSTAPDTDFFARLIDVAPDGVARDVAMGMVRARYRHGLDKPEITVNGAAFEILPRTGVTEFRIRLTATANEFQPGHRIRLDITSSDFPNYDRHHNTATDPNSDPILVSATQTIHHGGKHSSRLILPVIPAASPTTAASR